MLVMRSAPLMMGLLRPRVLLVGIKQSVVSQRWQDTSARVIAIGRHYSSSRCMRKEDNSAVSSSSLSDKLKDMGPQVRLGAGVLGGGVILYGISRLFFDVASSFMGLTPALSLKYGFAFGLVSGGTMAGLVVAVDRAIRARPEAAYQQSMSLVRHNDDVNALLGSAVKYSSNTLHRVRSQGGSFGVVDGRATWKAPRVELVYSPLSPSTDHTVHVVAVTSQPFFGKPVVEFCGVDVRSVSAAGSSRRLVLKDAGKGSTDAQQAAQSWQLMEDFEKAV